MIGLHDQLEESNLFNLFIYHIYINFKLHIFVCKCEGTQDFAVYTKNNLQDSWDL